VETVEYAAQKNLGPGKFFFRTRSVQNFPLKAFIDGVKRCGPIRHLFFKLFTVRSRFNPSIFTFGNVSNYREHDAIPDESRDHEQAGNKFVKGNVEEQQVGECALMEDEGVNCRIAGPQEENGDDGKDGYRMIFFHLSPSS